MIDLHTHILPSLDDGPRDLDGSLAMAGAAAAAGVRVLAATPHVREDFPVTPELMHAALERVRRAIHEAGVPLDVRGGGELSLDAVRSLSDEALAAFGLAGNPRYLLVETPYAGWPLDLGHVLDGLRRRGFVPVLAHPERNPEVARRPAVLEPALALGALVQVNASSLAGRGTTARTARALVENGLAHLVASDAHDAVRRPPSLAPARGALDERLAAWLTRAVPEAIVTGSPLPGRPGGGVRRRLRLRRD